MSWLQSEDREFEALADRLRDEGWTVELCGGCCPVQVGGRLPDGRTFFFRARGQSARLEVAGCVVGSVTRWAPHEAGWLPAGEAEMVLRELLAGAGEPAACGGRGGR